MNIVLLGYMGCGKSSVGESLARSLQYKFIDLDTFIEKKESNSISDIFGTKGEIYFRKLETLSLEELLSKNIDKTIISLGGGTPCYGSNLTILKESKSLLLYLNASVQELTQRLWKERLTRPLIRSQESYESLEEYVRKHLFERSYYYNQVTRSIKVDGKSNREITEEIIGSLF